MKIVSTEEFLKCLNDEFAAAAEKAGTLRVTSKRFPTRLSVPKEAKELLGDAEGPFVLYRLQGPGDRDSEDVARVETIVSAETRAAFVAEYVQAMATATKEHSVLKASTGKRARGKKSAGAAAGGAADAAEAGKEDR